MRCQLLSQRYPLFILVLVFLGGLSGCQTMNAEFSNLFGEEPSVTAAPPASPDGPKFFVEFRDDGRKPILVPVPLTDVLYVQQALEQTGALKRYRRAKIELYRQLPQGGGHKLPIELDRGKRQVPTGSDYALHPNDRIVITEDTSTIVDDMLESLTGATGSGK
jgi:hypothetical protein